MLQDTLSKGASYSLRSEEALCGHAQNRTSALKWLTLSSLQGKATCLRLDR